MARFFRCLSRITIPLYAAHKFLRQVFYYGPLYTSIGNTQMSVGQAPLGVGACQCLLSSWFWPPTGGTVWSSNCRQSEVVDGHGKQCKHHDIFSRGSCLYMHDIFSRGSCGGLGLHSVVKMYPSEVQGKIANPHISDTERPIAKLTKIRTDHHTNVLTDEIHPLRFGSNLK